MAQFVYDSFTEAADVKLTSHTGEIGATWTNHPASAYIDGSREVRVDATNDELFRYTNIGSDNYIYYASGAPANADQDVRATLVRRGAYNNSDGIRVYARMSTTATTGVPTECYFLLISNNNASGVTAGLYKTTGGTPSSIGTTSGAIALTVGSEYIFRLLCVGTSIRSYYSADGGGSWTGIHRTTDSSVTAANRAGLAKTDINSNSASAQVNITLFTADDSAVLPNIPAFMPASARALRGLYTR